VDVGDGKSACSGHFLLCGSGDGKSARSGHFLLCGSGDGKSARSGHFLLCGSGDGRSVLSFAQLLLPGPGYDIPALLPKELPAKPIIRKGVNIKLLIMLLFEDLTRFFIVNSVHSTIAYWREVRDYKYYVFQQQNGPES
jgi:hypothetical protein